MAQGEGRRTAPAARLQPDRRLRLPATPIGVPSLSGEQEADVERCLYEDTLRLDPLHEGALRALGHLYTSAGLHAKGLQMDLRLVRLRPEDGLARYNLACSHALLGAADDALDALEKAVALGYDDLESMLSDDDLASLRDHPRFERLCDSLYDAKKKARQQS